MGFAHYVRSPYAHAIIRSIDVSAGARAAGRLRHAHRRRGRDADRPVLPALDAARLEIKDYALAVGRVRFVGDPVAIVVAETRELARDAAELVEVDYEPLARDHRRPPRARRRARRCIHPDAGTNLVWEGVYEWGSWDDAVVGGRPDREDLRAALRPLQLDAARVRRRARRVQPRHRAVDDLQQQPVPGLRGDHDGARDPLRDRQAPLRHAGHRRRLRQQDHLAPAARRVLPARAQAEPRDPVDRVAHRVPPLDVARQRALVPRHRGRGQGRRHAARLPDEGARRRRRVHALRAARRRDLGAGDARHVPLAEHPARLHAGRDEQGAVLAEPRLLADAAPLVHRARDRHRRRRARPRPGRGAQAQLHPRRRDAVHDAERLRLRLGRLRRHARPRARA